MRTDPWSDPRPDSSRRALLAAALATVFVVAPALGQAQEPSRQVAGKSPASQEPQQVEEQGSWADPEFEVRANMLPFEAIDLTPPDGQWQLDEEGQAFFIKEVLKEEGTYAWISENQIRYKRWHVLTVTEELDELFLVKVLKPPEPTSVPSADEVARERAKELAQVAETYDSRLPASDRLQFKTFSRGLPKSGQWRNGFDVGDINGDGHPDIVHGPPRKARPVPVMFLGNGQGEWKIWREVRFPPAPYDYGDVAAADFNGDGLLDLAFAFHLRGLLVLVQDARGQFREWSQGLDMQVPGSVGAASGFTTRAIEVADWNGDGKPDLLAVGEGPRAPDRQGGAAFFTPQSYGGVVYLNQGNGKWRRQDQGTEADRPFGDSLSVGDLNADGRLDFVTASNVLNSRKILNLGRDDASWTIMEVEPLRPKAYILAVEVADLDGDGRDDLAVSYTSWEKRLWRTGIDVLYSRPEGWKRLGLAMEESRVGVWGLDSGDLNGDGHRDVAGMDGKGRPWFFLADGEGSFTREDSPEVKGIDGECQAYHLRLADLDEDGRDEIVAAFAGEPTSLSAALGHVAAATAGIPKLCPSGGGLLAWRADVLGPPTEE